MAYVQTLVKAEGVTDVRFKECINPSDGNAK